MDLDQLKAIVNAVDELRAEVERLREASGTCYSDECREPCQSQQRRARAELHEARAELAKVSTRLGEARRALADLRAGIETLRDKAARLGLDEAAEDANVLLATSGEQPGGRDATPDEAHDIGYAKGYTDGYREALAEHSPAPVEHACDNCEGIDPPSCINYPPPALATNGPAPVVPDSPDVRDITDQVRYAWCWYGGATREESDQRAAQFDTWLASLAVVGQGMTAEPVAVVERIHEDNRPVITARVYAPESWEHLELGTHLYAVVRSGEQGGEV